jgi:peroxiredoxin
MIIDDGIIEMMWVEPGIEDNKATDPFYVSDVGTMVKWLQENPNGDS